MIKKNQIGLKLWSTNIQYIDEVKKLYDNGMISYIELYAIPLSFNDFISYWKNLDISYIIHAPHYGHGLNLADKGSFDANIPLIKEAQSFCDTLKSELLIIHPGVNGTVEETAHQICNFNENRFIVENKPFFGLNNEKCRGSNLEEIKYLMENSKVAFCLDFGHAICAANALNQDPMNYIHNFNELQPVMYHISDGDYVSQYDSHLHFCKGSYPLSELFNLISPNTKVTIETEKIYNNSLQDFEADYRFLYEL